MRKAIITLPKRTILNRLQGLEPLSGMEIWTADFGMAGRIAADIDLRDTPGGRVLAGVLRHNGHIVAESQPMKHIPRQFSFSHDGEEWIVVVRAPTREPKLKRQGTRRRREMTRRTLFLRGDDDYCD